MKTYTVPVVITHCGYVTVQAENEKDALKIVNNMPRIDDEVEYTDSEVDVMSDEIKESKERYA